jgi:hypothetical protein
MKKIGRQLSEAAIMGSMEIWRRYARDMPYTENPRAIQMTTQKVIVANDKQANEQAEEDGEDQKSGSGQANPTEERSENQRVINVTEKDDIKPIEVQEADNEDYKEDEEEGPMQEAMQGTRYGFSCFFHLLDSIANQNMTKFMAVLKICVSSESLSLMIRISSRDRSSCKLFDKTSIRTRDARRGEKVGKDSKMKQIGIAYLNLENFRRSLACQHHGFGRKSRIPQLNSEQSY